MNVLVAALLRILNPATRFPATTLRLYAAATEPETAANVVDVEVILAASEELFVPTVEDRVVTDDASDDE